VEEFLLPFSFVQSNPHIVLGREFPHPKKTNAKMREKERKKCTLKEKR
jgi:hypothetical protein